MATTSIWSVKGWLGKVLIYIENPEKTENPDFVKELQNTEEDAQSLADVIAYAVNAGKTREKDNSDIADEKESLMQQYVSGVNCSPMTVRMEMMAVKKKYGKEEGIIAFHGYQSFGPGECTPVMAHEIGVKLAEELWGSRYQVLVATHLDKENHLHNHFVVNSVSFVDGIRYHRTNRDYRDMRSISDRLCKEYGLSIVEKNAERKGKHYGEWRADQEGRPSYRGMIKEDVDEAIAKARTEKQFFHYLKEKGYSFKIGKDITLRSEGRERGVKLARNFGEDYTMDAIRKRILVKKVEEQFVKYQEKPKKVLMLKVDGLQTQRRTVGGLRGLYLRYCYRLGILPKKRSSITQKQVHILLREDLCKLNIISKETRLLCRYRIDTTEQLFSMKEELQERMNALVNERKHLRYQMRSQKEERQIAEYKSKVTELTKQIDSIREEVRLCSGIAARSESMKEKLRMVQKENKKGKEEQSHEHIRGSC